jgi:peptidoglycan/LPS O-acetylase OafA/YrhL
MTFVQKITSRTSGVEIRYRPDIDGLRAAAVLPVVLYHYRIPGFSGGYVGVDVFFVISGYLISSLIYPQVVSGEFSIVEFYERRIRRLAPALLVVIAGTFILSYLLFFPIDFVQCAKSILAATLFVSNVFFDRQGGYFAGASYTETLLHTWSLAVEEQFYLIFPPTLILCRRFSRNGIVAFLIGGALASLVIAALLPDNHAFFLSPARGWECALGAILAISGWHSPRNGAIREALAVLGAAMVILPVLVYSQSAPRFPLPGALVPCIGATLLIWCGVDRSTKLGQALPTSRRVLRKHFLLALLMALASVRICALRFDLWGQLHGQGAMHRHVAISCYCFLALRRKSVPRKGRIVAAASLVQRSSIYRSCLDGADDYHCLRWRRSWTLPYGRPSYRRGAGRHQSDARAVL